MKCRNVKTTEYKWYQHLISFNWTCPACLAISPLAPPVISPSFQMEIDDSEDGENPYEWLENEIFIGCVGL